MVSFFNCEFFFFFSLKLKVKAERKNGWEEGVRSLLCALAHWYLIFTESELTTQTNKIWLDTREKEHALLLTSRAQFMPRCA